MTSGPNRIGGSDLDPGPAAWRIGADTGHSAHAVTVEAGKNYRWCACGKSASPPWCDDSHGESDPQPLRFTAERHEIVWLCGCKRTQTPPFCDGSHKRPKETC